MFAAPEGAQLPPRRSSWGDRRAICRAGPNSGRSSCTSALNPLCRRSCASASPASCRAPRAAWPRSALRPLPWRVAAGTLPRFCTVHGSRLPLRRACPVCCSFMTPARLHGEPQIPRRRGIRLPIGLRPSRPRKFIALSLRRKWDHLTQVRTALVRTLAATTHNVLLCNALQHSMKK